MSACMFGMIMNGELPFLEVPERKPCKQLIFSAISSLTCNEGVQEQERLKAVNKVRVLAPLCKNIQ